MSTQHQPAEAKPISPSSSFLLGKKIFPTSPQQSFLYITVGQGRVTCPAIRDAGGVPAMASWVKNLNAEAWAVAEVWVSSLGWLSRSQLCLGFKPWPRNFYMLWLWPLKKKMAAGNPALLGFAGEDGFWQPRGRARFWLLPTTDVPVLKFALNTFARTSE